MKASTHFTGSRRLLTALALNGALLLSSSAAYAAASIRAEGARAFNGSNSRMSLGDSTPLNVGTGNFTVGAWFKFGTPVPNDGTIVARGLATDAANQGIRISHSSAGIVSLRVAGQNGNVQIVSATPVSSGEWHHAAAVRSGTSIVLYIDGSQVGTGTVPANLSIAPTAPFVVGGMANGTRYFLGSIDNVVFYKKAVTQTQLYELMSVGPALDDPQLAASYGFERLSTIDESGHTDPLTVTNATETEGTGGSHRTVTMAFTGSGYLSYGNNLDPASNDFTLGAWLYTNPNATSTDMTVVGKNLAQTDAGAFPGYRLKHAAGGDVTFQVFDGTYWTSVAAGVTLPKGTWHHVAATRKGTTLAIYVDGKLASVSHNAVSPGFSVQNNANFAIGASPAPGRPTSRYFVGRIDSVSYHARSLGEREVLDMMRFGARAYDPSLRLWVPFDRGTAVDLSLGGHTPSPNGALALTLGATWPGYQEMERWSGAVGGFTVAPLPPAGGFVNISTDYSLNPALLSGVTLDERNLTPTAHAPYPTVLSDGLPAGTGPYVAPGVATFRLEHFTNELLYAGDHNAEMLEYAGTHGFNAIPYKPEVLSNMPAETKVTSIKGLGIDAWMDSQTGNPDLYQRNRYEILPDSATMANQLWSQNRFPFENDQYFTADLEGPGGPWTRQMLEFGVPPNVPPHPSFPQGGTTAQKEAFFQNYYGGFVDLEVAALNASRASGHPSVGIYGVWGREYWNLTGKEPELHQAWHDYGQYIAMESDVMYPSSYLMYASAVEVGYTLANLDRTSDYRNELPLGMAPALRPYHWTQLHGGGDELTRWWKGQPVRNEDFAAGIMLSYFVDIDGVVVWNYSGSAYHSSPPTLSAGKTAMTARSFVATNATVGGASRTFNHNDPIYVLGVTADDKVRFQALPTYGQDYNDTHIDANLSATPPVFDDGNYQNPVYIRARTSLVPDLQTITEPMQGATRGLGVVKMLEETLRGGVPTIDQAESVRQFQEGAPLVRHMRSGPYHLLGVYDPQWQTRGGPVSVTLYGLPNYPGVEVTVQADSSPRIYVFKEYGEP